MSVRSNNQVHEDSIFNIAYVDIHKPFVFGGLPVDPDVSSQNQLPIPALYANVV